MSSGYQNCPNCGRLITQDATICRHCGAELLSNNYSNITPDSHNENYNNPSDYTFIQIFTYMFSDKNFWIKFSSIVLIHFLIILLNYTGELTPEKNWGLVAFVAIFSILCSIFICGYSFSCVKELSNQNGIYTLPVISFWRDFVVGCKYFIASFIFGLSFFGLCLLCGFIGGFLSKIIPFIIIIFALLAIVLLCYWVVHLFGFLWVFANGQYFTSFFKWSLVKKLVRQSSHTYWKTLGYTFLLGILFTIFILIIILPILFIPNISSIVYIIILAILQSYCLYINSFLWAKAIDPKLLSELQ